MYIRIHVVPGARKASLTKNPDSWVVCVREPAEGNQANRAVREAVAQELQVPATKVRILTGHRSRSKLLVVDNE